MLDGKARIEMSMRTVHMAKTISPLCAGRNFDAFDCIQEQKP